MGIADITPVHPSSEIITGAVATSFLAHVWGWLPGAVAVVGGLLAIVWYTLMIAESKYVQAWLTRHMEDSRKRQIARLNEKLRKNEHQFDVSSAKLIAQRKLIEARLEALGILKQAEAVAAQKVETAKAEAVQQLAVDKVNQAAKGGSDART